MYGKCFSSLWRGSMRGQADLQLVFIYLFSHADSEGFVEMIPEAIADDCGLPPERVIETLKQLCAPDPRSRSPEQDGARLEPIDDRGWGWQIVNYKYYRSLQDQETVRAGNRKRKQKQRGKAVTDGHGSSRQEEGEVEGEGDEDFAGAGPPDGDHSLALTGPEAPSAGPSAEILAPVGMAAIVSGLAAAKEMPRPKRKADWQSGAWEDAQAIGRDTKQTSDLMAFAGWIHKQGPCDRVTLARIFRLIVTERILNPIAYFSRAGKALQSLLGQSAVERAESEQESHREADKRMGIGR